MICRKSRSSMSPGDLYILAYCTVYPMGFFVHMRMRHKSAILLQNRANLYAFLLGGRHKTISKIKKKDFFCLFKHLMKELKVLKIIQIRHYVLLTRSVIGPMKL